MVLSPTGLGIKNDYAGEAQQQSIRLTEASQLQLMLVVSQSTSSKDDSTEAEEYPLLGAVT
jgi:hypothetical protein